MGSDYYLLEYLRSVIAEAQAKVLEATTPESKRRAVEHFHEMLDEFAVLLSDEEDQPTSIVGSKGN